MGLVRGRGAAAFQALQWDAIGDAMKVQFVRSLRLARVLRGIRVMKLFRYVGALRMLGRR